MVLAMVTASDRNDRRFGYVITDDGWRCIYGLSRAQLDTFTDDAPAPFRVWQWPLEELQRGNVA